MAVSTNLGLYLPTREDYISVKRDLSDNYEVIDEHAGMMENGSAIVINGDTAPQAITSGQYLLIKNHTTLASGSYHATTNIANGATIDNSNVAIDTNGISNALKSEINTLDSKVNYDTLINLQQITTSYVTRNTYNSRKFSDYKMLVFTPYENNWARASCIVPSYVFENATGIDIRYYQGGNIIEVDIKRTSDTSYDAKYIGTPPSGEGIFIYCFGLLGN